MGIAFLTLMFLPVPGGGGCRHCGKVKPGGAIIVVDKEESPAYPATVLSADVGLQAGAGRGTGGGDAERTLLSGVQAPLPWELGPTPWVFRFGDFAGWLIEA
ncbi:MAG: class I SAM-dependent methyltransferase [Bilophila wadsworthia]